MSEAEDRRAALRATVVMGRGGHLFHRWDNAFEQLCDAATLDDVDLDRWRSQIEYRVAWCDLHAIRYYMMVVPEKHVVYEDRLPVGRTISQDRPVRRIHASLPPPVQSRLIYPATSLRQARRVEKIYYNTDVHWTSYGAYIGYRALLRGIAADFPMTPLPEGALIRTKRAEFCGDIGVRIDPEPVEERIMLSIDEAPNWRVTFDNRAFAEGQVQVFENDDKSLPRAVIFRDSNMNAVLPFLLRHLSRAVVVAGHRYFLHDLVQAEKPDLVITEIAERYLATPLPDQSHARIYWGADLQRLGFQDFTKVPLPLPGAPAQGTSGGVGRG
jgi:hypothetical protein